MPFHQRASAKRKSWCLPKKATDARGGGLELVCNERRENHRAQKRTQLVGKNVFWNGKKGRNRPRKKIKRNETTTTGKELRWAKKRGKTRHKVEGLPHIQGKGLTRYKKGANFYRKELEKQEK